MRLRAADSGVQCHKPEENIQLRAGGKWGRMGPMNDGTDILELSAGQADSARLRTGRPKHVDKTAWPSRLATEKDAQYFIPRPLRFGKLFMLSSLKALVASMVGRSARATVAVAQTRTRDCVGPCQDGYPPVWLAGANCAPAKRGIDEPLVELA